jgi:ParB-like chromosome segregation protein Spo0J
VKTSTASPTLPIAQIFVAELLPSAYNSRTHSERQIEQIANSIREFGFLVPVLIDERNSIIAGHGRVLAAKRLNMDTVPCIQVSHLTDTQKRAYIIADNKLTELGGWDQEILMQELNFLDAEGFRIEMTGFDMSTILPAVDDNLAEYVGMPEYNNENQLGVRHIVVHFKTEDAVQEFAKLVGQPITEQTRFLWHPREPEADLHGKVYG